MKIYTYFTTIPSMSLENEAKLILLWSERWRAAGFEPVVLNEYIARKHPYFDEFDAAVQKMPTTNTKKYEAACYHRWLAMTQVGGGYLSDYDVAPYGFKDELKPEEQGRLTCFTHNAVPCLVHAPAEKFLEQCQWFVANADYNATHLSDMYLLQGRVAKEPDAVLLKDVVKEYTEAGWETAKAVHYANSRMTPNKKTPRHAHIPVLRT